MKIVNKVLLIFTVVALFSSCTQRRYSQITGFQLKKKSSTEKVITRKGHYVSPTVASVKELATVAEDDIVQEVPSAGISSDVSNVTVFNKVESTQSKERFNKESLANQSLSPDSKISKTLKPKNIVKDVKSKVGKKTKAGGLIYWILVVILIILIVSLLKTVLGAGLTNVIITIVLIAFIGHLIGLW